MRAILDTALYVDKITAAFVPQGIKRTVTEQAVKEIPLFLVTGKEYTILVLKIGKIIVHSASPSAVVYK